MVRIYYIFSTYELPFTTGRLTEKDCIRAINDGLAPSEMSTYMIGTFFSTIGNDYLTFSQFCLMFNLWNWWKIADADASGTINFDEWNAHIDTMPGNNLVRRNVDIFHIATLDEILATKKVKKS